MPGEAASGCLGSVASDDSTLTLCLGGVHNRSVCSSAASDCCRSVSISLIGGGS